MRYINVFVCDDSNLFINDLKKMFSNYFPFFRVVGDAISLKEATLKIKKLHPVVVFFDVKMIDTEASFLFQFMSDNKILLILTTDDAKQAIVAFKYEAIGCVLKPCSHERLSIVVCRIYNRVLMSGFL